MFLQRIIVPNHKLADLTDKSFQNFTRKITQGKNSSQSAFDYYKNLSPEFKYNSFIYNF